MKSIILIPFAHINNFSTGVNIKRKNESIEVYLKNCCVACVSARTNNNQDTDVALVTNYDVPEKYKNILDKYGVSIITCRFESFSFGASYSWSLAFYKLCALKYVVNEFIYDNYAYLDSDVYVQGSFTHLWDECSRNILLYDILYGYNDKNYDKFLNEIKSFDQSLEPYITHYGGEFFAANRDNCKLFIDECELVYNRMAALDFKTTFGDEFITSIAASKMRGVVKNAGCYVFRFWTGTYRIVSNIYKCNPVAILHVPAEKEHGMINLFDKSLGKGKKLPANEIVHSYLHLTHASLRTIFINHGGRFCYNILKKSIPISRKFGYEK